MRLKRTVRS